MSLAGDLMDGMRDVLEGVFSTVTDLAIQVDSRMTFNPTPPCIDMYPDTPWRGEETAGFGDVSGEYFFIVRARVSTADHDEAQDILLELMDDNGALSVAAALEEDETLGGHASAVHVTDQSGFTQFIDTGNQGALLGATWNVTVVASPT